MIFGYERVSTEEQNIGRQREMLIKCGVPEGNIFSEKMSGKNMERPQLKELIARLRKGDEVVSCSIDRIGRNTRDFINLVEDLHDKGVSIRFIQENIDTGSQLGKLFLMIVAAFAEMERNNIKERQRQGIELLKQQTWRLNGRPRVKVDDKIFERTYKQYCDGAITITEAAKCCGISRATYHRRVNDYVSTIETIKMEHDKDDEIIPFGIK